MAIAEKYVSFMEYCIMSLSFIFQTPCSQCTSRIARNPIVWSHKSFCQYTWFYFYFLFFINSRDCNIVILTISDELTSHSLTDIALTKTFKGYCASTDLLYLVFREKFQLPLFSLLLLTDIICRRCCIQYSNYYTLWCIIYLDNCTS